MTKKEIQSRVERIKESKGDYESAHAMEDDLFLDFISYVSKRKDGLGRKAKEVLKSCNIDFSRYCA